MRTDPRVNEKSPLILISSKQDFVAWFFVSYIQEKSLYPRVVRLKQVLRYGECGHEARTVLRSMRGLTSAASSPHDEWSTFFTLQSIEIAELQFC